MLHGDEIFNIRKQSANNFHERLTNV